MPRIVTTESVISKAIETRLRKPKTRMPGRMSSRCPRAPARGGLGSRRPARRAGRGVDPVHRGDVCGPRSHPPRSDRDDPDGALPEGREKTRDAKVREDGPEKGRGAGLITLAWRAPPSMR